MCEVFWDEISDKNIEIDEVVSDARTLNDKAASISLSGIQILIVRAYPNQ